VLSIFAAVMAHRQLLVMHELFRPICVWCDRCSGEWVGQVPPYQLRFADGYEPDRVYWDDDDHGSNAMLYKPSHSQQRPVRLLTSVIT